MTEHDRHRWDERYAGRGPARVSAVAPPAVLAAHVEVFPTAGRALDLACGQGCGTVWLARRGLDVLGLDVSAVAISQARDLARRTGVSDRCRFDVFDLILCHKFRDRGLDQAIIERLAPGGLLAIAALSDVDAARGRFRTSPGELTAAFAELNLVAAGEGQGCAWLLARA
ncbi:class I SAM-dependent methyltransferase [Mycobacterium haemophilum]